MLIQGIYLIHYKPERDNGDYMLNLKNMFTAATLSLMAMGSVNATEFVLDDFSYEIRSTGNNQFVNLEVDGDSLFGTTTDTVNLFNDFSALTTSGANVVFTLDTIDGSDIDDGDGSTNSSAGTSVNASVASNVLSIGETTGIDVSLNLFYATLDGSTLDFSGSSDFFFDIVQADTGFTVDLTLEDISGQTEILDFTVVDEISSPTRALINFSDLFTTSSFDFTQVLAVNAFITSPAVGGSLLADSGDLTLDAVGIIAVPEPTTLAIFGLGLLGLGLRRRNA